MRLDDFELPSGFIVHEGKGFRFLTNFDEEQEELYRKVATEQQIPYIIRDDAYSGRGTRLVGMKAFYVKDSFEDSFEFVKSFIMARKAQGN